MRDEITHATSLSRLSLLQPQLKQSALQVYNECIEQNIPIYISETVRSSQAQHILYRYGRTKPPGFNYLTDQRPGYSPYEYGLALEFCFYFDGRLQTYADCERYGDHWTKMWIKVVNKFEAQGWSCGFRNSLATHMSWNGGHVENLLGRKMHEWYKDASRD